MHTILIYSILWVIGVFTSLTLLIIIGKLWRQVVNAFIRTRRAALEPVILAYAHGDVESLRPSLGGRVGLLDRRVVEMILLDHIQRVRGIEKMRLGHALDELGFVDQNLAKLRSSRWWQRADGSEKLGLAGSKRATERLVSALEDEIPEVRIRAAKALGAVGGRASAIPLIGALREPNRWSTIRIADILASMGIEVVDELISAFPGMTVPAKLASLDILAKIKPLEAVPWLRERLRDPESDVRARAANALGVVGEPGSGPALIEALQDPEWPVRAMAAKALGKIVYREGIEPLCNALRDPEWWVRANAAESLRMMEPEGIEALDRMVDDPDRYASHQAVLMLQEAGIVDHQVGLLADSSGEGVREAALGWIRRLVRIGQTGRLAELAVMHQDSSVRHRLAILLSEPLDGGEVQA